MRNWDCILLGLWSGRYVDVELPEGSKVKNAHRKLSFTKRSFKDQGALTLI